MTIQLHCSTKLANDLKTHLVQTSTDLQAMQWYGHRVQVLRRKCVVLMERQSRYTVVFPALTKPDFERFPQLLRDRIWREALAICELDDTASARLAALADAVSQPVQITPGSDRSVQAHINDVAWHLDWMANEEGGLPEDYREAFAFGLRMNQTPRSRKGEKGFFFPLEVMREFWLGLLRHASPPPDNVVPFRRSR